MRIHVTGSRGFIASHLTAELEAHGHVVTGSDSELAMLPTAFLQRHEPELVVHAGALVGRELGSTPRAIEFNVSSTLLLARACERERVPVLYLSSSEVYGPRDDSDDGPTKEDELWPWLLPQNLYGLTKRWGEEALRLELDPGLLTIARLSMPYGPGHLPGRGRAALTNFLWAALWGEPITVHRGARRSWCWVGDTVRALRLIAELGGPTVYNVGREDNELPMREVAELCRHFAASHSEIVEVDPPPGFTLSKRLDCSRLRSLGWAPEVGLEDGIRRTLAWLESLD